MSTSRSKAAAAMGRAKSPAKTAAARKNARKALKARLDGQTKADRVEQARKAAKAMWAKHPERRRKKLTPSP